MSDANKSTNSDDDEHFDRLEAELEDWEREALKKAERRFPISKADLDHEFAHLPQLAVRRIRGTYFSIHDSRSIPRDQLPEKLQHTALLIHSEKNRFRALCEQIMSAWMPELPAFVGLLSRLEPQRAAADSTDEKPRTAQELIQKLRSRKTDTATSAAPPAAASSDSDHESDEWQAESFGIAVMDDVYRVGYTGSGPSPMFASKDLILGILELLAEGLTTVGENLEFSTTQLLQDVRALQARVVPHLPPVDPEADLRPEPPAV